MTKPLAKSLHTISAIQNVARHLLQCGTAADNESAVAGAVAVLGYAGAADEYGLAAKALATMNRA